MRPPKLSDDEPTGTACGVMESPPGAEVTIDGQRYLYFAGTAYLALQGHPAVIAAGCDALQRYGLHPATSRGGFGAHPPLLEVERLASQFFGAEDAFYFTSGYWGNTLTLQSLAGRFDIAFVDEFAHYSVLDAIKLIDRPSVSFAHRDPNDLSAKLQHNLRPRQRPLVISDGMFPISGHIAPVEQYRQALARYDDSILALDDAHAAGVLGGGRGTYEHFGIASSLANRGTELEDSAASVPQLYRCATLSKAIGGSGGILAGSRAYVSQAKMSPYFNAAAIPTAPVAAATATALQLLMNDPAPLALLHENARRLRSGLRRLGLDIDDSPSPIICLLLENAAHMQRIQGELRKRGIIIAYFGSYTAIGSEGGLRIAVSAAHTSAMIEHLLDQLGSFL